ncbi:hypothetical protein ACVXZZ_07015 [Staphylococcus aureus]
MTSSILTASIAALLLVSGLFLALDDVQQINKHNTINNRKIV